MKKQKDEYLNAYHEDLVWMSYRYAIGRHTIAAHQHALNIAKYEFDNFNKEQRKRLVIDIRQCIADNLKFSEYNLSIDYSIIPEERKPLEFLLQYFIDNPNWQITGDYKGLTVFKDNNGNIIYEKKNSTTYNTSPLSIMILEDLLVWMDLASYFDEDNYKVCKVEHNGNIEEITYFDSYIYYQSKDDKLPYWKKVKKPIKEYIKYLGSDCYIPDDLKIIE